MPPARIQNKRAEKRSASLLLITVDTATPPLGHITPIAYFACSLAVPPIFSKVACTLISVNRLNSAVIVVKVHHLRRGVKSSQGFGFASMA